jgi:hypothetical protein
MVLHPRWSSGHRLTRLAMSCLAAAGVAAIASDTVTTTAAQAATPGAVGLTQSWIQTLNDAPCGVALASPVEATLDGNGPSVEVGDRSGQIYAFHISASTQTPTAPAGWSNGTGDTLGSGQGCGISGRDNGQPAVGVNGINVGGNPPVDSTASVIAGSNGLDTVYVDAGDAADPEVGGYVAFRANGTEAWNQTVTNPSTDTLPDIGVVASPSIGSTGTTTFVNAGALGQESYALNASTGAPIAGWPAFTADSIFSTAAVGDLYGSGSDDLVEGGASTAGFANGSHYLNGGHVRVFNDHGGLICEANTNEEVDSSPAVGPILPNGGMGIAVGTGSFYPGVSDEDTVKVYGSACNQIWSDNLDGTTGGSPALAQLAGNGQWDVVEGTGAGTVYALNAANGSRVWSTSLSGQIFGSVTTADLLGNGTQDVIVATTDGLFILNGTNGAVVDSVDDGVAADNEAGGVCTNVSNHLCAYGFQNAPLVTDDPDGLIGITVAGYFAVPDSLNDDVQGMVQHFEVNGSNGSLADAAGGWPQFHHDPSLSGFTGSAGSQPSQCSVPAAAWPGYLAVASDGGIFAFGQPFCGSTGNLTLNKPVVGLAQVPGRSGYWLVASDGGIFSFGDAQFYGSTGGLTLNKPVVGMAATPDGGGYWLVAADGGIFSFGDAQFYGSAASTPGLDVVGMAATPDGQGYWEVTSKGQVFAFGDAANDGSAAGLHLNAPIVGITPDPVSGGYWLVGQDGGVFSFGAPFFGSTGNIKLNQPVVGMQATDDGHGYWFVAADGGIFSYGDAPFFGSTGSLKLNRPVVGMSGF